MYTPLYFPFFSWERQISKVQFSFSKEALAFVPPFVNCAGKDNVSQSEVFKTGRMQVYVPVHRQSCGEAQPSVHIALNI